MRLKQILRTIRLGIEILAMGYIGSELIYTLDMNIYSKIALAWGICISVPLILTVPTVYVRNYILKQEMEQEKERING